MDFQIIWTEPAVADPEAIVRSRAEKDPEAAEVLHLALLDSVEILSRFPFIGPSYERDPAGRAREIFCQPYQIFYRVQDAHHRVESLTIWHASRSEPRLPESG